MSSKLFENASHFATGDVKIVNKYHKGSRTDPLELLLRHTNVEATHQSGAYSCAPSCHTGTRETVLSDIMEFIQTDTDRLRLAWLSGPAGAGKTCIQRSVVTSCLAEDNLAGSFFFGRDSGRDSADGFVATIAHQLCGFVPGFPAAMLQQIECDSLVFKKSLHVQLKHLILGPLESICRTEAREEPRVIIVDGLDECRDLVQRRQVIDLLRHLTQHPTFPFHVIVSSRPEFDILTAFEEEPILSITRKFALQSYDSEGDILTYLINEFAHIRRRHPARSTIPKGWPRKELLNLLVIMASGQFIFVSTIIKYVGRGKERPDILLDGVLKAVTAPKPAPTTPHLFAELDALYTEILSVSDVDKAHLRLVLHAIPEIWRVVETNSLLTDSENLGLGPSPLMIDTFFGLRQGTTDIILSQLYALIHVPRTGIERGYICFYHKSMEDYLKTPERSGDLFQSEGDTTAQFLVASIKNLQRWSSSILAPPTRDKSATLGALYLCIRFSREPIPKTCNITVAELQAITGTALRTIFKFNFAILLGWILLFGKRLWPQPSDMLNHMKPQSTALAGLRDHWLDPIAEGVKILKSCGARLHLRPWRRKSSRLSSNAAAFSRKSDALFSILEENWFSERAEKMMKLVDLERLAPTPRRRKVSWAQAAQAKEAKLYPFRMLFESPFPDEPRALQESHPPASSADTSVSSDSSGRAPTIFNFPSKSTQSLGADSWKSRTSSFGSTRSAGPRCRNRASSSGSISEVACPPRLMPLSPGPTWPTRPKPLSRTSSWEFIPDEDRPPKFVYPSLEPTGLPDPFF